MDQLDRLKLSTHLGIASLEGMLPASLQAKIAALAGAGDVLGFAAGTSVAAYAEVFGEWHTSPDLPQRFWQDPALRRRRYLEASVDPGLIEATPAEAVEVVIGSGLLAGAVSDGTAVALIDVGGVPLRIHSQNTGADAYTAIAQFERSLRTFIATKLAASAGPKWMKQRIDGPVFVKAKENRATALANGEQDRDLLAYVDVGDLGSIILRKDNWDAVFSAVFSSRERLAVDMQTLIATRRPTMHARRIDAVRLLELLCVILRLTQWLEDDGKWRETAESED